MFLFKLVDGRLYYQPLPNENGMNYTTFNFDLTVIDPARPNAPTATLNVTYYIHVNPVNDPPVLIPHWNPETGPLINECDEDTWVRVNFTATDLKQSIAMVPTDADAM